MDWQGWAPGPLAIRHELNRVLLSCDEDNTDSRAAIEKNGGTYEDTSNGKRRYWIDTA